MYVAHEARYETMQYKRCGRSGVMLPFLSLGLWHNFGEESSYANAREMVLGAFDRGITYFDIANNYGPPPGSAEECFGKIVKKDLAAYRDELFIATKAGYRHWPGPYGEWGSKKNLVASCNNSLKRLGLDYVDLFYHHRPDRNTPIQETIEALEYIVKSGKALYVGISNYDSALTEQILTAMEEKGIHCLVHQVNYNMFERRPEGKLFPVLERHGVGAAAYMCLAQGILTDRYFDGVKAGSRAAGNSVFLNKDQVTAEKVDTARALNEIAKERGQSLAQMALAWCYRCAPVATLIIGASRLSQIDDNQKAMENADFSAEELRRIDEILLPYAREAY